MFRREPHRMVQAVLGALREDVLTRCGFLFGGGTRIVLELEEFRESKDIDFLCSDPSGYADLRFEATTHGYSALFSEAGLRQLRFPREMRIDQYGIRFSLFREEAALKVELIREARVGLETGVRPAWSPVDCLALVDCYAEKLLANSDRWADRQVLSRDLIDLAALRQDRGPIPDLAWNKTEAAYKSSPRTDLRKALSLFADNPEYQRRCLEGLRVDRQAAILSGIDRLREEIGMGEEDRG